MKKIWNTPKLVKLAVSETMAKKVHNKNEYHNGSMDRTARIKS